MITTQTEREAPRTYAETHEAYEDEDDPMPHRYADAQASGSDREISLGTGTILAIFFALALVCSVFFGFGYTIGHKSTGLAAIAPTRSLSDAFKSFKPAPGGPAITTSSIAKTADSEDSDATPSRTSVVVPTATVPTIAVPATTARSITPIASATKKPYDPDAEIVTTLNPPPTTKSPVAAHPAPTVRTNPADIPQTSSPALPTGSAIVQVAAVTHQEDADTLIAALKRKGYTVSVRREPQDKYLHLQLGPYPAKKDAEAMRQRLQADGYNAILK